MRSAFRLRIPLDGFWRFRLDPKDVGEKEGWFRGFSGGDVIYVPSSWNEQNPQWDRYVGIAWYQRRFYVPHEHRGKVPWLVFKGAGYHAKVWLNGTYVGGHEGSFTEFRLRAPALSYGSWNTLVVRIDNRPGLDRLPPARGLNETAFDFFPYGGIHRSVYLELTSSSYVEELIVETSHTGLLKVSVAAHVEQGGCEVALRLLDREEREVLHTRRRCVDGRALFKERVEGAHTWSPDDPYLYTLVVELYVNGILEDVVEERIGFRSIEVRDGRILLNGRPVFLKGFGRHEDFSVTGKHLPGAVLVRDFYLMRMLGANSFRTSHYPYSDEHLDLADEMGFMVILETTVCLSGISRIMPENELRRWCRDPGIREKARRVAEEMIRQHRNRPSVIMYSIANEPPSDLEECADLLRELAEYVRKLDPSRPITFASHRWASDKALRYVDVISLNVYYGWYSHWGDLEAGVRDMLRDVGSVHREHPDKPIVITEFGAGAIAGLHSDPPLMWTEEYQAEFLRRYIEELVRRDYIQGLHIWNFADFRTPENPLRTVLNRKGVFTRDRQPKLSARVVRELFCSIPTFR